MSTTAGQLQSGGTLTWGSVLTLTASVTAGPTAVTKGSVQFCDATAANCTDVHAVGSAQMTSAGTAVVKFRPGPGTHTYKAVFAGTNSYATSASASELFTVTTAGGQYPAAALLASIGAWGNYSLTTTVEEFGGTKPLTGGISIQDTSNGNAVLGTASLGASTQSLFWALQAPCTNAVGTNIIATADFNQDGYLDFATVESLNSKVLIYVYQPALGCYEQTSSYAISPGEITIADFNSDGIPDIAIPSSVTDSITILLGNGDGTFTASSLTTAYINTNLVAADFNGDGIPDLAAADLPQGGITIYLGNGDGTFTAGSTLSASSPWSMAAGDFNCDGKLDLAVAVGGAVDVFLGNGDGTFKTGPTLPVQTPGYTWAGQITTADFNGDGKLDLAVSVGVNDVPTPGSVTILVGNGDGTFTAAGSSATPNMPVQLAVADFNHDGSPDVAALDIAGTITVLTGKGDGTFNSPALTATTSEFDLYQNFAVADMDGDGLPDLLYPGSYPPNLVVVYFGLTKPTETASTAPIPIAPPSVGQHLVVASYSGDANSTSTTSSPITLLGTPPATTTALALTANGGAASTVSPGTAITLTATVNSGGIPLTSGQVDFCDATAPSCTDVHLLGTAQLTSGGIAVLKLVPAPGSYSYKAVLAESAYGAPSQSSIVALTVTPPAASPSQTTTTIAQSGSPGNYTLTATVTGTGSLTAPTGNVSFINTSYANSVLATAPLGLPTPGIAFQPPFTAAISDAGWIQMAAGDFNGDGIEDIVAANPNSMTLTILLGKGDGTFTASSGPTLTAYTSAVVAGDFNADGKLDLAVSTSGPAYNSPGGLFIFLGNGDGTFTAVSSAVPSAAYGTVFAAVDFNSDGKLDLLINSESSAQILFGNGDGTFRTGTTNANAAALAVADLNGDGIPDLVAGQWNGVSAQVMLGKGDGMFTPVGSALQSGASEVSAGVVTVADFNGDGIPDLAVIGSYYSSAAIYIGKGDGTFTAVTGSSYTSVNEPLSMIAMDLNHDGKTDLAISNGNAYIGNSMNPDVAVLLGNGDGTFTSVTGDIQLNGTGMLLAGGFGPNGASAIAVVSGAGVSFLQSVPTVFETATATGVSPGTASPDLVAASYPGDSNYASSTSTTTALTAVAATPMIVQASGTYTSLGSITITEASSGVTVYYSGTGALATAGYVPYTGPIPIYQNGQATIQTYAAGTGFNQSATATASYTFNLPVAPQPTISLPAGVYPDPQTVTITSQSGTTIFYSTSGAGPSLSSAPYSGPVTVSTSEFLSAIAAGGGYAASKPVSAQYIISSVPSSFIYTFAGTQNWGYLGDGGPATVASLETVWGTAIDSAGNMYIADAGNNVVRKVAAGTGIITTVAGTGSRGYSGDGGPATSAQLSAPTAVAIDNAGNLYVAEEDNDVIRKIASGSGIISTFVGGPATGVQIPGPIDVAVDSAGNVYIATSLYRILEVAAGTGVITTVAGTGIPGYSGDGGPAVNAELNGSEGIAVDGAGNLYIADTRNSLVRKVTVSTGIVTTVAGTVMTYFHGGQIGYGGDGGPATSALISGPVGVAVDGAGNLYIADTGNDVIREVTAADGIMHTLAGSAYTCAALGGDGGPALEAGLCSPTRVSLDHSGNLYASEEGANRIREVTVAALPPTTAASAPQFSLQGGTYAGTQTLTISDSTPMAEIYVTFDGSTPVTTGEGYHGPITVTANATIKAVAVAPGYAASPVTSMSYTITAPPPALISTVVGGQSNPTLIYPDGVAFDSSGNMYIADYYGLAVWKVAAGTGAISVAAGMQNQYCATQTGVLATSTCLEYPSHVAVDNSSNLYISNSGTNTVLMVSAKTGLLSIYAGGGTGYAASFGDGGSATSATLSSPEGLAFDNSGNLYIADGNHGLIRMVAASTGIITTVAGNTTGSVLGEGGPATSALLDFPIDVAVDKNGNLFIADLDHYRVRMVAAGTGVITTVAGDGLPGDQGDGGPGTSAEVTPEGLAVDAAGNLYVSSYPDRVRKISAGGGSIATIAGNGYLGYTGDGGAATMAEISNPTGLAVDASGNLYFAAAGSAVVRKVTFPPPMTMPTIAWAAPAPITYGTALSAAQLNATSSVAGTFAYGPALGTVLGAGAQTLSVTFTPADTNDYSIATAAVQLTVNQAMPAITWATSVAIPYGTPLTSAQLNASANVPGTFTYTPTAGTVLPPGNNTLSVVFTPADTTDYTSATDNVTIVVDQPVPSISSLSPPVASAGGAAFTLTIYGTGFIQSSVVMLGNNALSTSYQSGTQLTAQVPAADIANAGIGFITVQNPSPGGGTSNAFQFEIDSAGSGSPTFTTTTVTVTPGTTATYPVTLPSGAINVSVSCLNLPAGTACSYSAANGSVSITTSSTTPAGTYQITIVFTETLPGAAAAWLLPLFLLPIAIAARRRGVRQLWLTVCVVAILGVAASAIGCGGGGNGGSSVQQTHQATSSGAVTLTVQ